MTVALWRPDIAPPHSLLYPAVLYQDQISTISPPLFNHFDAKKRIVGRSSKFDNSGYQRAADELREAVHLQNVLGDLHVATSFGALVGKSNLIEMLRQSVDDTARRHSTDAAVKQWNSYKEKRKELLQKEKRVDPRIAPLEIRKAELKSILADIEKRRVEARELNSRVILLRENLQEVEKKAQDIHEKQQYLLKIRSAQKSQNKHDRKESPEIQLAQYKLRIVLSAIRIMENNGESISIDLVNEKQLLQDQLKLLGAIIKKREGLNKPDSEIDALQDALVNMEDRSRSLNQALNQTIDEVENSFALEITEVKAAIESITLEIGKILPVSNSANSVLEMHGEWDFILEEKVGEHLAEFLRDEFHFHSETATAGELWFQAIWGPKVILAEILAVLADYFVQDKENWFTMGRTIFSSPQELNGADISGETSVSILQIVLPVPDPTRFNLEQIVEFRNKFNHELRLLREATSQLTIEIEQETQDPRELVFEAKKRFEEPLGEIDRALEQARSRLLVKTGAILKNPKILIGRIKESSVPLALSAGVIGFFSHDLVATASLEKFSHQGAVGLALQLTYEQVRGMKERRSMDKMGMRYLYELGDEFDVRFTK